MEEMLTYFEKMSQKYPLKIQIRKMEREMLPSTWRMSITADAMAVVGGDAEIVFIEEETKEKMFETALKKLKESDGRLKNLEKAKRWN